MTLASTAELVAELKAGRMIVLVDCRGQTPIPDLGRRIERRERNGSLTPMTVTP